ncbi:CYTH domain-containing protein [Neorhizobium sp. T786]|uniref:CYTH domain-containing protein n=1 Tax=Pseudorhizobium xiangyangii TaxID=2883104 RepID=UPI001CFFA760|nr:CYTH domain-containing protein [Neorhizobium xiangyangii]MCB5204090.1 CYTH domain-containing protein [Neorhizobium xiangyangii]
MKTVEIERKFLVRNDAWRGEITDSHQFLQGYLASRGANSVRVRIVDGITGRLAIKLRRHGLCRQEYEYEIPVEEAQELLAHAAGRILEKTRYNVHHQGSIWEVDVFEGPHEGLTIAEIEMSSESDSPALPRWIGSEVTGDKRYSNRTLAAVSAEFRFDMGRINGGSVSKPQAGSNVPMPHACRTTVP